MSKTLNQKMSKEYQGKFKDAEYFIVANYAKIPSELTMSLRKSLAEKQARMTVVKNSLAQKALAESGKGGAGKLLNGSVALFYGGPDVASVAKILVQFRKENKTLLEFTGAYLDGELVAADKVDQLSKLPGKQELRGRIVGCIAGNLSKILRVVNAPRMGVLYAVKARVDKGGEAGA